MAALVGGCSMGTLTAVASLSSRSFAASTVAFNIAYMKKSGRTCDALGVEVV